MCSCETTEGKEDYAPSIKVITRNSTTGWKRFFTETAGE